MGYALVAHASKGAASPGNSVTTDAIDTTGADLIVINSSVYGVTGSVSDSKGNTWTACTNYETGTTGVRMWYCRNPTVGSGHTFTVSYTGSYPTASVSAFSGSAASPLDQQSGSNAWQYPGSVTPSEDNELLICCISWYPSGTVSVDSSFAITDQVDYVSGAHMGGAMAYQIQTTATARNPTWSHSVSFSGVATNIATFKAAAAAAATRRGDLLQNSLMTPGFVFGGMVLRS